MLNFLPFPIGVGSNYSHICYITSAMLICISAIQNSKIVFRHPHSTCQYLRNLSILYSYRYLQRFLFVLFRDGSAKLWDVGASNCLDNILEGHGPINCCTLTTTNDEVSIENEREVSEITLALVNIWWQNFNRIYQTLLHKKIFLDL